MRQYCSPPGSRPAQFSAADACELRAGYPPVQVGLPGGYPGMLPEHGYSASMRTIIVQTSEYANVPRGSVSWYTARSHRAFC